MNIKIRLVSVLLIALSLSVFVGLRNTLLYLIGLGFGIAFVKGRLGFTSGWRRLVMFGDTGNFQRQLIMMALAIIVFTPLFAAFGTLSKALAPIAVSGVIGAFIFGIGMQLSDGCGSGTLYKTGSNSFFSQTALIFFVIGNFLATLHFHHWLALGAMPPVDLAVQFGTVGGAVFQIALLAVVYGIARFWSKKKFPSYNRKSVNDFSVLAIVAVIVLAVANLLLAGQMWGVVYAFGLWGAKLFSAVGGELASIPYWNQEVTAHSLKASALYDITTLTNLGLILGAWLVSTPMKQNNRPVSGNQRRYLPIIGGLLLGYGSRLGFGCNIGAFFSGLASGSLHGWVWLIAAFCGSLIGIQFRKKFGYHNE